jgi:hypothetical protein
VQFGHAGARSGGDAESAQGKNAALREAGAVVPDSFEGFEGAIRGVYQQLVKDGVITPAPDVDVPVIPMDLEAAMKAGKVGAWGEGVLGWGWGWGEGGVLIEGGVPRRLARPWPPRGARSPPTPPALSPAPAPPPRCAPPPTWCRPSATTVARSPPTTASP